MRAWHADEKHFDMPLTRSGTELFSLFLLFNWCFRVFVDTRLLLRGREVPPPAPDQPVRHSFPFEDVHVFTNFRNRPNRQEGEPLEDEAEIERRLTGAKLHLTLDNPDENERALFALFIRNVI